MPSFIPRFESWDERRRCSVIPSWDCLEQPFKQGASELYGKKGKWYIAIPITFEVEQRKETKVMGVDLGLRSIAVASVKSLFFKGNQVAFVRRRFAARRRKLGKLKKLSAIKKSKDKESRWMKDQNHKISHQIVDFAWTNGVDIIRMEV